MAVPKVDKIVINMGVGEAVNNAKLLKKLLLSWHLFQVKNHWLLNDPDAVSTMIPVKL